MNPTAAPPQPTLKQVARAHRTAIAHRPPDGHDPSSAQPCELLAAGVDLLPDLALCAQFALSPSVGASESHRSLSRQLRQVSAAMVRVLHTARVLKARNDEYQPGGFTWRMLEMTHVRITSEDVAPSTLTQELAHHMSLALVALHLDRVRVPEALADAESRAMCLYLLASRAERA